MEDEKLKLAKTIYDVSHITGEFILRSGANSSEYFDKYLFESCPVVLGKVALHMRHIIPAGTEVLAGLEMGGIPVVTVLSGISGLPAVFVRKKAKEYGTCKSLEGTDVNGKRVLIVEDVVTSGRSALSAAENIRREGGIVERVLCVIDRESVGRGALSEKGLELEALFTMSELKNAIN